ncbi:alpha/beta-hydrolase [Ceraceosorus guamensis]|uniref:Alpha/beta-hydrolase n=1 Tax=Ceraceosorus guamensis TaxID=1522189 RepID=A0A316WFU3_9BASI|nr:alpha/beta-hydrolase [Ceraceosorus guamensis]PWN46105.1 alpha/beta-hydrolase [Ceraceosorus guamensis]
MPNEKGGAIKLDFTKYSKPADGKLYKVGDTESIVVAHGLFGSKTNWRSIARRMAEQFGVDVYTVDLRNHGDSGHADSMTYMDHARDLENFLNDQDLTQNVALIGHSMGGKAVQTLALDLADLPSSNNPITSLISVDMTPARGALSPEFANYLQAMIDIDAARCTSNKEADEMLQKWESDPGIRAFLLTNLTQNPVERNIKSFRIPVRKMQDLLPSLGDFPFDPPGTDKSGKGQVDGQQRSSRSWDGHTLFIKGERSKYINRHNIPICDAFFPNAQHASLDTGHWVQAEKPLEFAELVKNFLLRKPLQGIE